jgi:hypothetical protein
MERHGQSLPGPGIECNIVKNGTVGCAGGVTPWRAAGNMHLSKWNWTCSSRSLAFLTLQQRQDPMNLKLACAAPLLVVLGGCAINQTVKPVERFEGKQVCIIENTAVKNGFLETYRRVLTEKGYTVRQLPPSSSISECAITSTYTANWRWDLALYMAFADIKVYSQGQQSGQATYDALHGGANMGKFIKGETKITELVNQLFPGGAGS